MKYLKAVLFLCSILILQTMNAQKVKTKYYNNFGQSLNNSKYLAIDTNGLGWMSGYSGLVHFDGASWMYFNSDNSPIIGNITAIGVNPKDNTLWFGSNAGGLYHFDGTDFVKYTTVNSQLPNDNVLSIGFDATGNVWLGTGAGVAKFDGTSWVTYNKAKGNLPDDVVSALEVSGTSVWVGTSGYGLASLVNGTWTTYTKTNSSLPSNSIASVDVDKNGKVWIGTEAGLALLDGSNWTIYNNGNSILPSNFVMSVVADNNNTKWIGTMNGLVSFDGSNWTLFNENNSDIPGNQISTVVVDKYNKKWVVTNGFLGIYNNSSWVEYNTYNTGLATAANHTVAIDSNNVKWFSTGAGLSRYENGKWKIYNQDNSGLPNSQLSGAAVDSKGNVWVGSLKELVKFDGVNWTVYGAANGLPNLNINEVAVGRNDTIWVGTNGGGLVKFFNGNSEVYTKSNSGLTNDFISSIVVDRFGIVWVANSSGLNSFNGSTWTNYTIANSGYPEVGAVAIAIDRNDKIWVTTDQRGVVCYNRTNSVIYDKDNSNLNYNALFGIAVDQNNHVFVGSAIAGTYFEFDGTTWKKYNTYHTSPYWNVSIDKTGVRWLSTITQGTIEVGICIYNDVTVNNNTITAKADNAKYQWIDCATGKIISGETKRTFIPTKTGRYAVIVANNDCADTSACVEITLTGINDVTSKGMNVYPNPTKGSIEVDFTHNYVGKMEIIDMTGRVVMTCEIEGQTNCNLSVVDLNQGLYILRTSNASIKFYKE